MCRRRSPAKVHRPAETRNHWNWKHRARIAWVMELQRRHLQCCRAALAPDVFHRQRAKSTSQMRLRIQSASCRRPTCTTTIATHPTAVDYGVARVSLNCSRRTFDLSCSRGFFKMTRGVFSFVGRKVEIFCVGVDKLPSMHASLQTSDFRVGTKAKWGRLFKKWGFHRHPLRSNNT